MKKMHTLNQDQKSTDPGWTLRILAIGFVVLLFILSGFLSGELQAQCAIVETGDITGNVPYGSSINWANPNRVEISDDLYARTSMNAGDTTKIIKR